MIKKFFFILFINILATPLLISTNLPEKKPIHKLQKKLSLNPIDYTALFQLGNEFFKTNSYNEAIIYYKKTPEKNPLHKKALYNLGLAYYKLGLIHEKNKQIIESITYYKKAINLDPNNIAIHTKLGTLYNSIQEHEKAIFHLEEALELSPDNTQLIFFTGNILNNIGHCKKAAEMYLRAAEINPQSYGAIYNAGYSLKIYGEIDKTIKLYKKALEIKPDYDSAKYAMALAYLYKGDFKNGWKHYENRLIKENRNAEKLRERIKTGNLQGLKIFIVPEGGFGDTIQFIQCTQKLKDMGAYVMATVQKPLYKLLKNYSGIDQLIPPGKRPNFFDDHASIMSLPAILNITEKTIPKKTPYIFPDKKIETKWKHYFAKKNSLLASQDKPKPFRIGLCWQSDLKNDESRPLCAHRSIPLKKLEKLSQIPNIEFYSIQKNINPDHLQDLSDQFVIHDFGPDFDGSAGPFMDTAAIMKQLDLIISVDTSIPHLAGALGAQVWVMLPYNTDWRWIINREDSPWYPTMRIFKQPKAFDWDTVVDNIFQELSTKLSTKFRT